MTDYGQISPFPDDDKRPRAKGWPRRIRIFTALMAVCGFVCITELVWRLRSRWMEWIFTDAGLDGFAAVCLLWGGVWLLAILAFIVLAMSVVTERRK